MRSGLPEDEIDIIAEYLKSGKARLFIGAGLPRKEAGLPGFSSLAAELLRRLAESMPKLSWCMDLLSIGASGGQEDSLVEGIYPEQAAELRKLLDQTLLWRTLHDKLSRTKPEGICYQKLAALANKGLTPYIYTTNYDDTIRQYIGTERVAYVADYRQWFAKGSMPVKVVHLHGHVQEGNFIITESDILQATILRDKLYAAVKADLLYNTLVFIGYGLRDASINLLFALLDDLQKQSETRHFAVFPLKYLDADKGRALAKWNLLYEIWEKRGITLIDIDYDEFLTKLINRVDNLEHRERLKALITRRNDLDLTDAEQMVDTISESCGLSAETALRMLELLL